MQVGVTDRVFGNSMSNIPALKDSWLCIKDGIIEDFGLMSAFESEKYEGSYLLDASGKFVLPCWCDSHTHIVYAGSRETEFNDRLKGLTYQQIAESGGGILNSAKKLQQTSEEELYLSARQRLEEVMQQGTGAIEIKSGYGLTLDSELKMLRVIKKLKESKLLAIKSTFLGAHAIPTEYKQKRQNYIKLITEEMLPKIAEEKLADYCDVFCEEGYFTKAETIAILTAAQHYGIKGKVHANQMNRSSGVQAGVQCNAVSVDHLEFIEEEEINLLKSSNTIPTLLPGAQFFLGLPNPPVRKMIDAGLPVAISSDYNPGSCPSGNMHQMMALGCILYKMTPEEALNAVTINSAAAMNIENEAGSICKGKKGSVIVTKRIPSLAYLPYSFGSNLIDAVIINGKQVYKS